MNTYNVLDANIFFVCVCVVNVAFLPLSPLSHTYSKIEASFIFSIYDEVSYLGGITDV